MPVSPTYPGVYVQEVPSGVRTIAGVSTSIALFIGRSTKAPESIPHRCHSFTEFTTAFGDDDTVSNVARQVKLFFLNGGTDCYVMALNSIASVHSPVALIAEPPTGQTIKTGIVFAPSGVITVTGSDPDIVGQVTVTGTNSNDQVITETIPSSGNIGDKTSVGSLTFKSLTSFTVPAFGDAVTVGTSLSTHGAIGLTKSNQTITTGITNTQAYPVTATGNTAKQTGKVTVYGTLDDGSINQHEDLTLSGTSVQQGTKNFVIITSVDFPPGVDAADTVTLGGAFFIASPSIALTNSLQTKTSADLGLPAPTTSTVSVALTLGAAVAPFTSIPPNIVVHGVDQYGAVASASIDLSGTPIIQSTQTFAMLTSVDFPKRTNTGDSVTLTGNLFAAPGLTKTLLATPSLNITSGFNNPTGSPVSANGNNDSGLFGTIIATGIKLDGTSGIEAFNLNGTSPVNSQTQFVQLTALTLPPQNEPGDSVDLSGPLFSVTLTEPLNANIINATSGFTSIASAGDVVKVVGNSSDLIGDVVVKGVGADGNPLSETISLTGSAAITSGTKKFLAIQSFSVPPSTRTGRTVSLGKSSSLATTDYETAYDVIFREVDLFNLMILCPTDPASGDVLLKDLYGEASAFCDKRRAFLMLNPPEEWIDPGSALSATSGAGISILRGEMADAKKNSAVFFPNLKIYNDATKSDIVVGPAGAMAGIFARTDGERGVWKAPAGVDAALRGISGLEIRLSNDENGDLNQQAINCLRIFESGIVSWGARTLDGFDSNGSEYKYIPVRRLALFMEESLYRGLKWVVFEPNDEPLWAQIRLNVGAFMHDLFRNHAFQGSKPSDAYFVKCDSETTTQTDINNGKVNIWVGFAPLKPAEFVILYLQQMAGNIQV